MAAGHSASAATPASSGSAPPVAGGVARQTSAGGQASEASAPRLLRQPDAASAVQAGFVEVCGYGRVRRADLEPAEGQAPPAWARALGERIEAERARLIERLEAGTARQRVAAALLNEDVQAAATLARATEDAAAYRMALLACRRELSVRRFNAAERARLTASSPASAVAEPELPEDGPVPTNCSALSLERLKRLQPGAASPWFMQLGDSLAAGDEAGVSEALYQIAQRPGSAADVRVLSATVAEVVGVEPTPGESMALATAVGRDMASLLDASMMLVGRACRLDALKDANRRQLCEQVARLMPDMARETLDAVILHRLEKDLGLVHSPQALSKADYDSLSPLRGDHALLWVDEPTCTNFSRDGRQIVAMSRQGELAYLRERLKGQAASASR